MINRKRYPTILESNILYLFIGILLITLGSLVQSIEVYVGLLITEYLIILLPILLYLKTRGYSIKDTLRINRITLKQVIYTIIIVMVSYPIAVFFNYIGIIFLSKYGQLLPSAVPIPASSTEFVLGLIIISITPGICEEVMFRGMLMKSYEPLGREKAIIYSAILFGIFHFNLQNLLGPTFLGILFGILVYRTNSIITSVVAHMTNNLIALLIGIYSTNAEEIAVENPNTIPITEEQILLYGAIVMGIIAVVLGFIVYRLIKSMPTTSEPSYEEVFGIQIEEYNKEQLYKTRSMDIIESLPLFLFIIIFLFFNYKYFFTLV